MNKTKPPISDKNAIRLLVKESIAEMSEGEKQRENQEIYEEIRNILSKKSPETLIVYSPLGDEVNIASITQWYTGLGKKVIQVAQHPANKETPILPENSGIIVPGRAFTKNGKRIGRGGGFYDQLLEKNPKVFAIGVCFSVQIFPDLPQDTWDKKVERVVFGGNTLE